MLRILAPLGIGGDKTFMWGIFTWKDGGFLGRILGCPISGLEGSLEIGRYFMATIIWLILDSLATPPFGVFRT